MVDDRQLLGRHHQVDMRDPPVRAGGELSERRRRGDDEEIVEAEGGRIDPVAVDIAAVVPRREDE